MPEWPKQVGADWVAFEEQLAPEVWLFACKRPDGYDWSPYTRDHLVNWAHVYVLDRPVNDRGWGRKTLEHYELRYEDPLMLSCLEYEMRKKYAHSDAAQP